MRRDRLTFAMIIGIPIIQLDALRLRHQHRPEAAADRRSSWPIRVRSRAPSSPACRSPNIFASRATSPKREARERLARRRRSPSSSPSRPTSTATSRAAATRRSWSRRTRPIPPPPRNAVGAMPEIVRRAVAASRRRAARRARSRRPRPPRSSSTSSTIRRASTSYNIVPGLIGVILTLTTTLMTALALTREIERGTMENLLAMPVRPIDIMIGKIVPYVGLGLAAGRGHPHRGLHCSSRADGGLARRCSSPPCSSSSPPT